MKAKAVGGLIVPDVVMGPPIGGLADCFLPAIGILHGVSLDPAAAGKPNERRPEIAEHGGEVRPQTVLAILPSLLWEKRDHINPESPFSGAHDLQNCPGVR